MYDAGARTRAAETVHHHWFTLSVMLAEFK